MDPETKKLLGEILKELKALNKKADKLIEAADDAASSHAAELEAEESRRDYERDRSAAEQSRDD